MMAVKMCAKFKGSWYSLVIGFFLSGSPSRDGKVEHQQGSQE
jgi:hypothetical protein